MPFLQPYKTTVTKMIRLTPPAEQRIKDMLSKRGKGIGIRLGVKTTGCSGLAYIFEYVDKIQPGDQEFAFGNFLILIDSKSYVYLQGIEIDYVKKGLNEGFEFVNPRERGRCGCGISFSV
jgi:iron-sulfur cluster assembly protein